MQKRHAANLNAPLAQDPEFDHWWQRITDEGDPFWRPHLLREAFAEGKRAAQRAAQLPPHGLQ